MTRSKTCLVLHSALIPAVALLQLLLLLGRMLPTSRVCAPRTSAFCKSSVRKPNAAPTTGIPCKACTCVLEEWLVGNGVQISDKVASISSTSGTYEETEGEDSGLGFTAQREISKREVIIKVPADLMMTKETAASMFGPEIIDPGINEYAAIALQLIKEKYLLGSASFWHPYVDSLPSLEEVGVSFIFSEDELALLEGSQLRNSSLLFRRSIEEEFRHLQDSVFPKRPDLFPSDMFTIDHYKWSYSMILSRSFRLSFGSAAEVIALVPGMDLINHGSTTTAYAVGEMETTPLLFARNAQRYAVLRSDRRYRKGEQVYLSYGPKSNAELLLLYGFALEHNSHDYIVMPFLTLLEISPMASLKKAWLDRHSIDVSAVPLSETGWRDLMPLLRLIVLLPSSIKYLGADKQVFYHKFSSPASFDQAFDEDTEAAALLLLKRLCKERLMQYPETFQADRALLQDRARLSMLPKTYRNAVRVRFGEMRLLLSTMRMLDQSLLELPGLFQNRTPSSFPGLGEATLSEDVQDLIDDLGLL